MGPKAKVPYVVLSNDPYVYVVNVLIWVHVRASNGATRDVCFPYKFGKLHVEYTICNYIISTNMHGYIHVYLHFDIIINLVLTNRAK